MISIYIIDTVYGVYNVHISIIQGTTYKHIRIEFSCYSYVMLSLFLVNYLFISLQNTLQGGALDYVCMY